MRSGVLGAFDPQAEKWVLTTAIGDSPGYITANLSRNTNVGCNFVSSGGGMTVSSGVFTFPSTGLWEVTAKVGFYSYVYQNFVSIETHTTTNNSSYILANVSYVIHPGDASSRNLNGHTMQTILFGVKDTTNYKVKFKWERQNSSVTLRGASTYEDTGFGFKKVAPASALSA